MKAITVWQPWAQLLAEGKKHDETRSWRTNYRGEILIHAAKSDHSGILLHIPMNELKYFQEAGITSRIDKLQTGAIIGSAILTDCKLIDQEYHDFIKELCPEEYAYGLRLCLQGTGHGRNQGRAASHCTGIGGKQ